MSEWISVDDRIPSTCEDVLVCVKYKSLDWEAQTIQIAFRTIGGSEVKWMGYGIEYDEFYLVTHWMPLPELPKLDLGLWNEGKSE